MNELLLTIGQKVIPPTSFLGEITEANFISAADLITATGMGPYGSVTNANITWLKYTYKGKITYLAKKPLKHQMTWDQLNSLGLVNGTKQVTIGGKIYSVRLPWGYALPPSTRYDQSTGGDLNDLIYPVYGGVSLNQAPVQAYPRWAAYTDAELGLGTTYTAVVATPGAMTWVQDTLGGAPGTHMLRFYNDSNKPYQLLAGWGLGASETYVYAGWRPILEEV